MPVTVCSALRRFARRSVFILSLILLTAQQSALLHALSHFEPQSLAATDHQDGKHDRQPGSCKLHLAFASLDGGAQPAVAFAAPTVSAALSNHIAPRAPAARDIARGYFSRAPPDLA
jgi:hypothetical protein